jgi:hypothetical protein
MICPSGGRGAAAELEVAVWIMARRIDEDELIEHFTLYPEEQVAHPAGAGEFVQVGGDAVEDRLYPCEGDGEVGGVRPVGHRAQVDRWWVSAGVELGQPVRAPLGSSVRTVGASRLPRGSMRRAWR